MSAPIELLLHHIRNVALERMGRRGEVGYYTERQKAEETIAIEAILADPAQPVRIVSRRDVTCSACPFNVLSEGYDPSRTWKCSLGEQTVDVETELSGGDRLAAKIFGVYSIVDGDPISSEELLEKIDRATPLRTLGIFVSELAVGAVRYFR